VSHNLASQSAEVRADIEHEKKRWHEAWLMVRNRHPQWIRHWLTTIEDQSEKDDWRHRLNTLRQKS
jgi:hypothetical protein